MSPMSRNEFDYNKWISWGFETRPCDLWKGIINIIMDKATTIRRFVNLATNNRTQSFFRKKLCKYPAKSSVNFGQPCLCARAVKADEKWKMILDRWITGLVTGIVTKFSAEKSSYMYHCLYRPYGGVARTVCISRQASDWIFIQLSWRWIILWSASINNPEWIQEGGAISPHTDRSPSLGNYFKN